MINFHTMCRVMFFNAFVCRIRKVLLQTVTEKMVWYYAVRRGKNPGIYTTWPECQEQIKDFKGPRYKKFPTEEEAQAFVDGNNNPGGSTSKIEKGESKASKKGEESDEEKRSKGKRSKSDNEHNKKKPKIEEPEEEDLDPDVPKIYTDGCCIFNGNKGQCSGIGVYWGKNHPNNVADRIGGEKQSVNRAEILAVCKALEQVKAMGKKSVIIHTDNQYLLNGASKWLAGWKKKGWTVSSGAEVKNREEFEMLDGLLSGINVKWILLEAHKGIEGKEEADKLAISGAKKNLPGQKATAAEPMLEEEEIDPNALKVYTDGCCICNGKKGACAGFGVYWGKDDPKNVSERVSGRQTNNRAEILAACKALEQVKEMDKNSVVIYTDSQFLINGATKWIKGWKKKNWKLASGGAVKNKEEFEVLDSLLSDVKVKWIYVPGHKGIEGNEAADKLAVAGAKKDLLEGSVAIVDNEDDDSDYDDESEDDI